MSKENEKYIYGGQICEVSDASEVSGMLIKLFGGGYAFRVYRDNGFIDYRLGHDDLSITIDSDALASFYVSDRIQFLDHSPEVLALKKAVSIKGDCL